MTVRQVELAEVLREERKDAEYSALFPNRPLRGVVLQHYNGVPLVFPGRGRP